MLCSRWPGLARGFHLHRLGREFAAILDVATMPAIDALAAWTGRADAWFLDGFSPRLNPEMWRADLLRRLAQRSAPGARVASYTAAGAVRRDLAAAGFSVERLSGAGSKRHRLVARLPGRAARRVARPSIVIVGANACASLARAFASLGREARVVDAVGPGAAASAPPAALVAPRLDAGLAAPAALFAQAWRRATDLYDREPGAIIDSGLVQFETREKDHRRFAALAASNLFDLGQVTRIGYQENSGLFDEPASPDHRSPALGDRSKVRSCALGFHGDRPDPSPSVCRGSRQWRGMSSDGAVLFEADIVWPAAAGQLRRPRRWPAACSCKARRAQPGVRVGRAAAFGGYAVPAPGGTMFGATHDRDDRDSMPRAVDEARNLALVASRLPGLAKRLAGAARRSWAAVRAATSDYLPIAGELAPGLFVLGGLGSRGFTMAPLLAEHIAAMALDIPSPLAAKAAALVSPDRFALREARRSAPTARAFEVISARERMHKNQGTP